MIVKPAMSGPYMAGLVRAPKYLTSMLKRVGAIVCAMVMLKKYTLTTDPDRWVGAVFCIIVIAGPT